MDVKKYADIAIKYAEDCVSGAVIIGADAVNACQRFLDDLKRPEYEFKTADADKPIFGRSQNEKITTDAFNSLDADAFACIV